MVTSPYVGLPNVIAGRGVAPEFLQGDANVENLYQSVLDSFSASGDQQKAILRSSGKRLAMIMRCVRLMR